MTSVFTPNVSLEEPARGDLVGVWDTPVNNNDSVIDRVFGGIMTLSLNNSNVVLSAPQYQCRTIIVNSTLTGSVSITFPSTFIKSYEIQNLCTGTSAFTVTLTTSVPGQVVGCPPGDSISIINDGVNITYHNLDTVGAYWDYAGSSIPNWISVCTIAPYLNCDGSTFSAAAFPLLALIRGSTTLPDARGRTRFALNAGTSRITTAGGGVNGDSLAGAGGNELLQSHTHINTLTDPGHTHATTLLCQGSGTGVFTGLPGFGSAGGSGNPSFTVSTDVTGVALTNASFGAGNSQNTPPAYVGGLTLIRTG